MLTLLIAVLAGACGDDNGGELPGIVLEPSPAPNFRLNDAAGKQVELSEFRGSPVALTFLYTECPDVCPVIAQRLGAAMDLLEDDAAKVAVVAVSLDPEHDTPERAMAFMRTFGLTGERQHYLIGSEADLAPVWSAYGVSALPSRPGALDPEGRPVIGRIGHTDAVYLIDRDGQKRTLLRGDATAQQLADGLRRLLR